MWISLSALFLLVSAAIAQQDDPAIDEVDYQSARNGTTGSETTRVATDDPDGIVTVARLENHESTEEGIYFDGWGSEFYGRYQTIGRVWPGIVLTLVLWIIAASCFSLYLDSFANYSATYVGLTGIMTALIFLWLMAAILIFDSEFNAAKEKVDVVPDPE